MDYFSHFVDFIWILPAPILLIGLAAYFSKKTSFIQFRVKEGLISGCNTRCSDSEISSFSSFMTTLAATLGTGNIIGVSLAIAIGGPGAVFWCFLTGVLGMSLSYTETFICKTYSCSRGNGGPMHVLFTIMNKKKTAIIYSIIVIMMALFSNTGIQAGAVSDAAGHLLGFSPTVCALILICILIPSLSGGNHIHTVCNALVPFMGIIFLLGICCILIQNHVYLFPALKLIISSAFTKSSFFSGTGCYAALAAMRQGISRGLFTNEAGLGTSTLPACETQNTPHTQGLINMSASFTDTCVLCTITGIAIICAGLSHPDIFLDYPAVDCVCAAFDCLGIYGSICLYLSIIAFGTATLIGWYHFGRISLLWLAEVLHLNKKISTGIYTSAYILMCAAGAFSNVSTAFIFSDLFSAILLAINSYMLIDRRKCIVPSLYKNQY